MRLRVVTVTLEDAGVTDLPDEPTARAALDSFTGIRWRPLERDDLRAVARFYRECETHDANPERTALSDLEEYWDSERSVPEEDTLAGWDGDDAVVAVAWSGCNRAVTARRGVHLGGAVHPRHRGRGIGRAVLRWQLAHAVAWDRRTRTEGFGPLVVRLAAPSDQADVRDLAARHGMPTERYFFEMSRPLTGLTGLSDVPSPTGIRLTGWAPERSAEVHHLLNVAFRDHWGHVDSTPQMWQEQTGSSAFRPGWSVLAVDKASDEVVGAALNTAYEQDWEPQGFTEGYTDMLGVARDHRGRGIASALLLASMHRFREAGLEAAGLGVDSDNPSGALRLYEGLGYRRTASTVVHQLAVDDARGPGEG